MIRNIQKLSGTALIADVFILIGLLYVFGYEIDVISRIGVAPIQAFNPDSFALLIGTAVFAFEGIGLVSLDLVAFHAPLPTRLQHDRRID